MMQITRRLSSLFKHYAQYRYYRYRAGTVSNTILRASLFATDMIHDCGSFAMIV